MNQCQSFGNFTGTESYHKFNDKYVFTDGIKWLLDQIYPNNLTKQRQFLEMCIYFNGYKYPFISIHMNFDKEKNAKIIEITDGDGKKLHAITPDFDLDDGEYKIYVYNFVILAASEY